MEWNEDTAPIRWLRFKDTEDCKQALLGMDLYVVYREDGTMHLHEAYGLTDSMDHGEIRIGNVVVIAFDMVLIVKGGKAFE